jgi:hypothetical protein
MVSWENIYCRAEKLYFSLTLSEAVRFSPKIKNVYRPKRFKFDNLTRIKFDVEFWPSSTGSVKR